MVFESGVLSIGNCLICLDPKSCIFIFFFKKLGNFFVSRVRDLKKKSQNIFLKNGFQKWGAIDRKLFDSPRSKILHFHFFQKNFENFCVTRWGLRKKNHKIFFWKMVFKSGVQSIGNFLICLDPKSCIFIFFSKNLENFCSARWGLIKIAKYFFEKWFLKVGCNQ